MTFIDTADPTYPPFVVTDEQKVEREPALLSYWRAVRRWRWVILTIMVGSLLAASVFTLLTTAQYTATTRISIERPRNAVQNAQGREDNRSAVVDLEFYQTQYGLLRARSLAQRVARSLNLASDQGFVTAFGIDFDDAAATGQQPNGAPGRAGRSEQSREDTIVSRLLANATVAPVRGSSLVDISFVSPDPVLSARIANEWARQFTALSVAGRFASSADARAFLETRLNDLRNRLEQSERNLVTYAANRQIITLRTSQGPEGRTRTEQTLVAANLESFNQALAEATAARAQAESRARGAGRGSSPAALQNSAINGLRQRRAELAAEYQRLLVQFEPGYPAARQLQAQIARLDQAITTEESRVQNSYSTEYRQALQREQSLQRRVDVLKADLIEQQRDSIQYNIYQREVDTNRQLYEALLQRYRELGVEGVGLNNITVVDRADVPLRPSSPNLILNLLLGLIVGAGLSSLTTFALIRIDESVREPDEITRRLHVPLLGAVPASEAEDMREMILDAKSAIFEAYLAIYTNLAFATDHGFPKSLMITSGRAAEGKTTTSVALATVLARSGRKVALIDADMRSPSIHGWFEASNERGLSHSLSGEDEWQTLMVPTQQANLLFMPAGPQPPNAAELLQSDRFDALIRNLNSTYDHVVIDAPPVLGLADAPMIASKVEAVAYVVEANGMRVRGLTAALDRLRSARAHLVGAVLTKFNAAAMGYGYGYGYGYGREEQKGEGRTG